MFSFPLYFSRAEAYNRQRSQDSQKTETGEKRANPPPRERRPRLKAARRELRLCIRESVRRTGSAVKTDVPADRTRVTALSVDE